MRQKRKISVVAKTVRNNGNKGVVSRILPLEDMSFLTDGTRLPISRSCLADALLALTRAELEE